MRKILLLCLCSFFPVLARAPIPGLTPQSRYAVYYGDWSAELLRTVTTPRRYDLLIVHPKSNLTRATVAALQAAGTRVLCYLSVGEDDQHHTGASWYYDADRNGAADRNADWDSYFANVADPAWRQALKSYTNTAAQGWYGYDYSLQTLGCDGLFLDTIDTVRPAAWGGAYAAQLPAMLDLIAAIRADIPRDRLLIINRGLFYFAPYDAATAPDGLREVSVAQRDRVRQLIDGVLIESWLRESHRTTWAARINAQAHQPDGFTVFALDYAPTTAAQLRAAVRPLGWLPYVSTRALDHLR